MGLSGGSVYELDQQVYKIVILLTHRVLREHEIIQHIVIVDVLSISCKNYSQVNATGLYWWQVTLVQERLDAVRQQTIIRTNVEQVLCCHMASLGDSELNENMIYAVKSLILDAP